MDTTCFHSKEGRLEESLRAAETLIANGDDLAVGKLIGLLEGGGGSSSGHLLLEVKSNIAELLLDVTDNLTLSSGGERVATLSEDLHQVVGEFTSSKVKTDDGMGKGITFIDGDSVGDTITRVHDDTSGTSRGVKGRTAWMATYMVGMLKVSNMIWVIFSRLALGLRGASVRRTGCSSGATRSSLWKVWCQIFSMSSQLVMIPCSTGYFKVRIPLGLGLVTDISILLSHTYHDTHMPGTTHNRGEDSPGGVVSGKAGLAHPGAIVTDKSGNVLVTHVDR